MTLQPIVRSNFPLDYLAPNNGIQVPLVWAGMGPENQVRYFVVAAWRYLDEDRWRARVDETRHEFFLYEEQKDEAKHLRGVKWMRESPNFVNLEEQRQMAERIEALRKQLQQ